VNFILYIISRGTEQLYKSHDTCFVLSLWSRDAQTYSFQQISRSAKTLCGNNL